MPADKLSLIILFSTFVTIFWYTKETYELRKISSKALIEGEIMRKKQIKTDLRIIGMPLYNNQPDNSIVGRIIIKNKSIFKAEDVEANAEGLAINQKGRKNFLPCPLNWTHSQLFSVDGRYQPARNIHPRQSVYLDIYKYYKESNNLKLATIAGQDIEDFSSLKPGENNVTIRLYQESGQTLKIELTITWNGKSNPTIKIDHFFRLLN